MNLKPKNISLYTHFPFCKSKCPYCDFNSRPQSFDEPKLLTAYLRELSYFHKKTQGRVLATIYFGGGTPSLASPKFIGTIIAEARKLWGLTDDCEVSMEANPTSVESAKLKAFKDAGINRISLGIQSLIDSDLHVLGRQHTAKEAREAIAIAHKVFGKRYSIDLIYTRPNQKISDWKRELAEAIKLSPYHISLYQLTIEGGTKFGAMYDAGKLAIPDNDTSAESKSH